MTEFVTSECESFENATAAS